MARKVRRYAFDAINTETGQVGVFFLKARSLDDAERIRWNVIDGRGTEPTPDPAFAHIECAGYIGPMHGGGHWVVEADERWGFVDAATLEAERRAAMPVVEHDPALLAEFVERHGCEPKRGNVIKRNLLGGGVFEIEPDAPAYLDPSCEAYHTM